MADDRQEEIDGNGSEVNEVNEVEVDEETQKQAEERVAGLEEKYEPGNRPTVTLPGTGGMVSGTAFADMVDDNGEMNDGAQVGDPNNGDPNNGDPNSGDPKDDTPSTANTEVKDPAATDA
ncbi:MAG: hypothetical protein WBQ44_06130 [Rhodococcus sp. (in: high G+C Gram-positive bacteria)]